MSRRQRSTAAIVSRLLEWYPQNARDLPWRQTNDPYAIWISEVMLQQTQVRTVLSYWTRWMGSFPNVQALAASELETVLKHWEGLGYYSRARNLHAAARHIAGKLNGTFPRSIESWLELPGVGRYTAGAVCSISLDQPAPIVDGNVARVLSRLDAIPGTATAAPTQRTLWQRAEELVRAADGMRGKCRCRRPCSTLNQALMELGALICTPRSPACGRCPLSADCLAHRSGNTHAFPARNVAARQIRKRRWVVLCIKGGRVLLARRQAREHNSGLWEFPGADVHSRAKGLSSLLESGLVIDPNCVTPVLSLSHTITRYRIEIEVWRGRLLPGRRPCPEEKWYPVRALGKLPMSAAHRRIANWLHDGNEAPPLSSLRAL